VSGVPDEHLPVESHEAYDRFGKAALRTAHGLGEALSEQDGGPVEPVVLRTDGPHRSLDGLMALIDEALIDEALIDETLTDGAGDEARGDDAPGDGGRFPR
jgi:hypothetical protein